jgi:hypothetical protein
MLILEPIRLNLTLSGAGHQYYYVKARGSALAKFGFLYGNTGFIERNYEDAILSRLCDILDI